MAGEAFGLTGAAIEQELRRVTEKARMYSDLAEQRATSVRRMGNTLTIEQSAAMATMYEMSAVMLQVAVTMIGITKVPAPRGSTGPR